MKNKIIIVLNVILGVISLYLFTQFNSHTPILWIIFNLLLLFVPIINIYFTIRAFDSRQMEEGKERIIVILNILLLIFIIYSIIVGGFPYSFRERIIVLLVLIIPTVNLFITRLIKSFFLYLKYNINRISESKLGIRTKQIIKNNKIIITIILVSLFPVYFLGIRPYQIRKECSTIIKSNSYIYTNSNYNEVIEKQKREKLGKYILCRNSNLAKGDQIFNLEYMTSFPRYPLTQTQYNTLSIDNLNRLVLGKASPLFYIVYFYNYNAYVIDNSTYEKLKETRDKYLQCNFPDNFIERDLWGGGSYTTSASDTEYKTCLRKNGLEDNKKSTAQEMLKNMTLCYEWYGKEKCDDPKFNPQ